MTQAPETEAPAVAEAPEAAPESDLKRLLDRPLWRPPTSQETEAAMPGLIDRARRYHQAGLAGTGASEAQTIGKVLVAWEFGKQAMWGIQNVSISKDGRPTLAAAAMRALFIERSGGGTLEVVDSTPERCVIRATRPGQPPHTATWDEEDSQRAGLKAQGRTRDGQEYATTHGKYPQEMKLARCTSRLARLYWPDILGGATYCPEDLADVLADPSPTPAQDAAAPTAPTRQERQAESAPSAPPPNPRREIAMALAKHFPDVFNTQQNVAAAYEAAVPRLAAVVRKCDLGIFRTGVDLGWTDLAIVDDCKRQLEAWKAEGADFPPELLTPIEEAKL